MTCPFSCSRDDHGGIVATGEGKTSRQEERELQDSLRAIANRRDSFFWGVERVVPLHSLEDHDFSSRTLEEGLAWCLV
jgi:hypothetical protein